MTDTNDKNEQPPQLPKLSDEEQRRWEAELEARIKAIPPKDQWVPRHGYEGKIGGQGNQGKRSRKR